VTLVRVLETLVRFTPLGVRFWDAASDLPILDPLEVRAWRDDANFAPVTAVRSASGAYAFHDLPGMRDVEFPRPDVPATGATFIITVIDQRREFLPTAFGVDLPLAARGLFPPGGRAFLFPSPGRTVAAGLAVVRADLWDSEANAPASWAVLDVLAAGSHHLGIADARGSVLVLFPVPPIDSLSAGSPPGSGQVPLSQVVWAVSARVRYQPSRVRFPLQTRAPLPWAEVPNVRSVLEEQNFGSVEPVAGTPASAVNAQMRFGEPLVLRSVFAGPQQRSQLLVRRSP
jgi:hypothetical protein